MRKYQVTSNKTGAVLGFVEANGVFGAINHAVKDGIVEAHCTTRMLDFFLAYDIECVGIIEKG